jgi:hypothetical protein
MKKNTLIDKVRTGDVIGVAPWWHNRILNFLKLWILRDWEYAKNHWKEIVPVRFYVVCKRESDLLYAATAYKKRGRADIKYISLAKLGRIVYIGRNKCFNSLQSHMRLNQDIAGMHYFLVAGYDRKEAQGVFYTNKFAWLNAKFVVYAMSIGGYNWHEMAKLKYFRPKALDIIELGGFERV